MFNGKIFLIFIKIFRLHSVLFTRFNYVSMRVKNNILGHLSGF